MKSPFNMCGWMLIKILIRAQGCLSTRKIAVSHTTVNRLLITGKPLYKDTDNSYNVIQNSTEQCAIFVINLCR